MYLKSEILQAKKQLKYKTNVCFADCNISITLFYIYVNNKIYKVINMISKQLDQASKTFIVYINFIWIIKNQIIK